MAGITQYLAILNSVARSFLAGSDSNGNLSPAHTLVDQNGVPVSTGAPLPVSDASLAGAVSGGKLQTTDSNGAAFQGVIPITPATPVAAGRSIGYVVATAGVVTFTLADASTIALTLSYVDGVTFQTLPFAVTNVALTAPAAGSFWNLK